MSITVNIENYESYYLDFLEGNLGENEAALLLAFLDQNPSLKTETSEDNVLSADFSTKLDNFTKSLLKFPPLNQAIDFNNIDYFLIASLENQLSEEEENGLRRFLVKNPALLLEEQLYKKSILLSDKKIVFAQKQKLKKGLVIPMYARFLAAAAGVALLFNILNLNSNDAPNHLSNAKIKNAVKPKTNIENQNNGSKQSLAEITSEVYSAKDLRRKTKVTNNDRIAEIILDTEISPLRFKAASKIKYQPLLIDRSVTYIEPLATKNAVGINENTFAVVEMKNPIKPITSRIGEAINQQIEFTTTRAARRKSGGFLFKIGKFEVSRKVYENASIAAK